MLLIGIKVSRGYRIYDHAEIRNFSSSVEIIFQHDSEIWYLQSGYVMFFLLYKHQWNTKPFHFNVLLLWKTDLSCNY